MDNLCALSEPVLLLTVVDRGCDRAAICYYSDVLATV